jgi:hypothetical protein
MNKRYHISPEGRGPEPSEAELLRYRDSAKLIHNYQRAKVLLHRRPLYRDPKAFLVLMLIVLLAIFIAEVVDKEPKPGPEHEQGPHAPTPGTGTP